MLILKLKEPLDSFQEAIVACIEEWGAVKNVEKIQAKFIILINVTMSKVVFHIDK